MTIYAFPRINRVSTMPISVFSAVGGHIAVIAHHEHAALRDSLRADEVFLSLGELRDIVLLDRLAVNVDNALVKVYIDFLPLRRRSRASPEPYWGYIRPF